VRAAYRKAPPRAISLAQDDIPADVLRDAIAGLGRRWLKRFDEAAEDLAKYFATAVADRSDAALRRILRRGGISVKFRMGGAARDVLKSTIAQNVSLIKSIPQQYLTQVEGAVMRSVQTGRGLKQLVDELQEHFGVTRRRAETISIHQNNMATGALLRVRELEIGLDEAVWLHSHAGREPRPTHLANHGNRYKIAEGWYDPAEKRHILTGELIGCRCTHRVVVPGFD
jgi:hypothetical protein